MEKLVDALLAFPTSQSLSEAELSKQCNALLTIHLHKYTSITFASAINGTNLLDLLNPATNSLGYVFVLAAKLELGGRNATAAIWGNIVRFLQSYNYQQIKHAPKEFRRVVDTFCNHVSDTGKYILAIKPLKKALLLSNPSHFSFMHTAFARFCIKANCYRDALSILDIDIFDFPTSRASKDIDFGGKGFEVAYQDVLQYYLYGAMLYMGMKKWRRSLDYLAHAIAAPASGCSAIQVEAYKKYILVGLLHNGKTPTIPKCTPISSIRMLKALSKPYDAFANAFKSGDTEVFRREIASTADHMRQDGNAGLAAQCMDAFQRIKIIALRDIYVTLGVDEIAQKKFNVMDRGDGLEASQETEQIILGMIERDEISASLSQTGIKASSPQTIVHFDNNPTAEARNLRALEEQIQRIVVLNEQVKQLDRTLGLSKEWIQYMSRQNKSTVGTATMNIDPDMMDYDSYGDRPIWGDDDAEEVMQDFDEGI